MAVFKCKICGGNIEVFDGQSVVECEYCGTSQTVSKSRDEVMSNLFNRANNLRIKCEFDRAEQIYEKILEQDNTEAEAHWGIVLCRYGVEYVKDPKSNKRMPTCHRTSYEAITSDADYIATLENADIEQKLVYEAEAKAIDTIQKNILSIVKNEEPYDVFICYKETDNTGRRTQDSVIANDIYYQLTNQGFKVFYAAITLEDKLGSAYEPCIFAALNSAKVMLVVGTKPEFFSAVWVKNEWSRFLKMMKNDRSKALIPCYKDMDAYELPEEFAHLQAQDMSKIGFINDIVRGIEKIAQADAPKTTVVKETVVTGGNANTASLLKRAFMFLEDKDWDSADEYCERVLDIDPENAMAYLGKLMAELKVKKQELLKDEIVTFDSNNNYQKAVRFADEKLKATLSSYIDHINTRNMNKHHELLYNKAKTAMSNAEDEAQYKAAADLFKIVSGYGYKDSDVLAKVCFEKAEEERRRAEEERRRAEEEKKRVEEEVKKGYLLFEEYKAAKNGESEKVEADKMLTSLNEQHNTLTCLKNDWQNIEDEWFSFDEKSKSIQSEIASLNSERSNLGLFSGKRKKEIANSIEVLEKEHQYILQEKGTLQKRKKGYETIRDIETEIENTVQQIEAQKEAIEILSSSRSSQTIRDELSTNEAGKTLLQIYDSLPNVNKGACIKFGTYEQDNDTSNGKEDIEWLVLEVKDDKALVISKYVLDQRVFHDRRQGSYWHQCSLREWLNHDFINTAFSAVEKSMIPTVNLDNSTQQDQVFLLSIKEAEKYFNSARARQCKPTNYAVANGVYHYTTWCRWWLRTVCHYRVISYHNEPATRYMYPNYVSTSGEIFDCYTSNDTNIKDVGVRPVLWIKF